MIDATLLSGLSPSRRTIIREYLRIRQTNSKSTYHIAHEISVLLGYSIDVNGSNSHVMKVLREYFDKTAKTGLSVFVEDMHAPSSGNRDIAMLQPVA
jgi:hypothetical protein